MYCVGVVLNLLLQDFVRCYIEPACALVQLYRMNSTIREKLANRAQLSTSQAQLVIIRHNPDRAGPIRDWPDRLYGARCAVFILFACCKKERSGRN